MQTHGLPEARLPRRRRRSRLDRGDSRGQRALLATDALPIYSFRGPRWIPGVDWSDHASFRRFGFDAVMVTDTAFLRNPRYHTRGDTPDTLDCVRMAAAVRALHGVVRSNPAP